MFCLRFVINQKFRAYILESDRSMDLVAYLLCYCLEIKDKPRELFRLNTNL